MKITSTRDLYRALTAITHDGHRNTVNANLDICSDGVLIAQGGLEYIDILRNDYPRPARVETASDVDYGRINALLDLLGLCD